MYDTFEQLFFSGVRKKIKTKNRSLNKSKMNRMAIL